ncbi:sensor histidine kinase [Saccharopolyspora sp. NFXS83]|uniref:sensor histidine kinase n=1 Tax=Saccharopolyspora sp. NFXS83 TaxID=2993560 RepID=UPI00224B1064|nr:sensor histidine kinase [Saccharopolyspora sp. NFXS83]MCX2733793.1 sensor histidine kinase [Saccharopolyspora sp. NFXS83]
MNSARWTTWAQRYPYLADAVLAGFVTYVALLGIAPADVLHSGDPGPVAYTAAVLGAAPLVLRRRYPLIVLVVVALALTTFYGSGCKTSLGLLGPLVAIYTVAVRHPLNRSVPVAVSVIAVVTGGVAYGIADFTWSAHSFAGILFGATQAVIAVVLGYAIRVRGEQAERLRHERDLEAERAVTEERMRIAHELHDVVAHHLSVVSVQASLARYVLDSDLETAREALNTISATTTSSLDELGRLLRVLRPSLERPDADTRFLPQPGLDELPVLLERVRSSGVAVELRTEGEPRALSPGAELCAYRVVQEALTNVLKHAPAATADVVVRHDADAVTVLIRNEGAPAPKSGRPSGHGLIGMCERAKMYGGTVEAGRRPEGGFQVTLRIPRAGD